MKLRSLCDAQLSTKSTIAGILRPAKCTFKNARGVDNGSGNPVASNKETSKPLVQCPLKHIEVAKAPDNQMVAEETRLTKDYLQNNMFRSPTHKESAAVPPPSTTAESQATGPKKQLPVFAKICSKTDPDSVHEGLQNTGTGCLGTDIKWEEGTSWVGSGPVAGGHRQQVWQSLLYTEMSFHRGQTQWFLTFSIVGSSVPYQDQLPASSLSSTASDKNNLKYNGNVFTPRFATTSTTTSLNQPVWLSLNYPPPPIYPNHSNFPQFQGVYQQRARIPYQQTLHPPLGCYSRQVTPYNPQQIFRSPYTPLLNYIPLVQPGYSYQQRNPSKPSSSVRDPPAMAGDGPQYHFSHSYGYVHTDVWSSSHSTSWEGLVSYSISTWSY
uniref:Chromosome 1 open reading frame 94 n=1 Tax=Chelydra serpentina TaxID=8475 RepID=A0A8C3T673_CHESE